MAMGMMDKLIQMSSQEFAGSCGADGRAELGFVRRGHAGVDGQCD